MKNAERLQENMRSKLFELMPTIPSQTYNGFLTLLAENVKQWLPVKYAAFYVYNNWRKAYELTVPHDGLKPFLFDFKSENQGISMDSVTIPIYSKHGPNVLLYLFFENGMNKEALEQTDLLIGELEKIIDILNSFHKHEIHDERNTFLLDVTAKFYASIDKKSVLEEIIKAVKSLYPHFSYHLLLSQDYEADSTLPVKLIEYSDDATKRLSMQTFMTGEVQLEDRVKDKTSCMYVPLKGNQGVYGVLQIIAPQVVDFPKEDVNFVSKFAKVAGQALEIAALYQHSKHLVSDLKLINDAIHQLNSNLQLSEITSLVKQQIIDTCNASQVGFIFYNEDADKTIEIFDESTDYFKTQDGTNFAGYITEEVLKRKEAIFSGDLTCESIDQSYRSLMAIPMIQSGKIHGLIVIMHENTYYFSFSKFKLMQSLIQHTTLALSNAVLRDKLERAAITDYLTNLYSRNFLDQTIHEHMKTDEQGTLVLIDIDDFKRINDTYGHYAGDKVIVQVSKIIRMHIGEDDLPARWGGEELAIYLPNASIDDGVQIAAQIRKHVENFTNPNITLSCGVSTWSRNTPDTVQDVFIRADKALYEAKSFGKNCVVKRNRYGSELEGDNKIGALNKKMLR